MERTRKVGCGQHGRRYQTQEGGSEQFGFVGLDRNERLSPLPQETIDAVRAALTNKAMTTCPMLDDLYSALAEHLEWRLSISI